MQSTIQNFAADRPNLGHDLAARLHELIAVGELADGTRINEVHLSRELGVSRTPLREALINLVAEGVVESKPRRGFFVAPFDAAEIADLYAMRTLLDPEALAMAGIPAAKQLQELEALNAKLVKAHKPELIVELDNQWHRLLIAHCPNRALLWNIEQFITLTRRYERAYFRETAHVDIAFEEHDHILTALNAGDLKAACNALRQNMQSGLKPLQDWINTRRLK
ncbi:MAG: GntR family transcriptional regulator [Gammaproteobacteria bacterium]